MKCALLCVALFAVFVAAELNWRDKVSPGKPQVVGDIWSDCSAPGDKMKIVSVKITPDPPVKGGDLTINSEVSFMENVTSGEIVAKIKYGFIPVTKTLSLCDEAKVANLPCPITAGNKTLTMTQKLDIPGGHYTGNVKATDQSGKELFCVNLDLHL